MGQGFEHSQTSLYAWKKYGWTYPSNFLGIFFEKIDQDSSRLCMDVEDCFRTSDGKIAYSVLGVFADVAFSNAARFRLGTQVSLATISLHLSIYQLPQSGRLTAVSVFEGSAPQSSIDTAFITVKVMSDTCGLVASGRALMGISPYKNTVNVQELPMEKRSMQADEFSNYLLNAEEHEALDFAQQCQAASHGASFIENYWGGAALSTLKKDVREFRLQRRFILGNRAGNIHGGILYGFAAHSARALLGCDWEVVDSTVEYLSAGIGDYFDAHASIERVGRNIAVIDCWVVASSGKKVITSKWTFARKISNASEL